MYGFCSSNALYPASLLFRMFIFILSPFDTWDCCYFGLNLSLVLLTKKASNVVFQFSKNEEITLPHELIFAFIRYFTGAILSKKSCEKWEVLKRDKRGRRWPYRGVSNLLHTMYFDLELTLKIDDGALKKFKEIVIFGILGLS